MAEPTAQILHLHGTVILGEGRIYNDVWVDAGRITLTRPTVLFGSMRQIEGWIVPGLVDVHCHVGLGPDGAVTRDEAVAQAVIDRDSGVLAIRDAGSPLDTSWVNQRRDLPRLMRAGKHLARPKRYLRHYADELDDPSDLPSAMAEQARRGDGWVKLVADWIDRDLGEAGDLTALWDRETLTRGISAAHQEAARVTAHVFSHEAIGDLIAAGVDGIEHGTGILEEHLDDLVAKNIPVTPTLLQVGEFERIAAQADGKYPRFAARMRALYARRYEQVRMLHDAGIQLLVGTDAGGTIGHGQIAREAAELVAAGIPASDVVAAASWRGRAAVGFGELVEGGSADFVAYPRDPRQDISALGKPSEIILRGRVGGIG